MSSSMSIAMCTYNGGKYLTEQLESIKGQSVLPYELIVCDDGSVDDTLEILKDFALNASFPVKISVNEKCLGYVKNFEKAISLCTGDIIALSDHDDVWKNNKLELLQKRLDSDRKIGYVFSDAEVVDENLVPMGYRMWDTLNFPKGVRHLFMRGEQIEILLSRTIVTGATMAFRSDLRSLILPISENWVHDAWIAFLLSASKKNGCFIEKPLILYRQHASQQIGGKKKHILSRLKERTQINKDKVGKGLRELKDASERLIEMGFDTEDIQNLIVKKVEHLSMRQGIVQADFLQRIKLILHELWSGGYKRYSGGWKSALKDLFLS